MKKLLLVMLMFLFVLPFSGCTEKVPEKIETHIDSPFTANMGDLKLSGLLIYTDDGEMYLDYSTPDELYGMSFSWKDDFTMGYRGLNAVTESDYLPPSSFAQSIKNSLDSVRINNPMLEKSGEDETYTATGKSDSGDYKIHTNTNGEILSIEVVGADITLRVNDACLTTDGVDLR